MWKSNTIYNKIKQDQIKVIRTCGYSHGKNCLRGIAYSLS